MTDLIARVRIHWHALIVALLTALPLLLDQLQVIDLKPLLSHYIGEDWAALLVGLMPFYIAFLRQLVTVDPAK